MSMSYSMLDRYLERAAEVASLPETPSPVARLYSERLAPVSGAYRAAGAALIAAEAAAAKERREAGDAGTRIAGPYKLARSIVRAHDREIALPDTLAKLATDTDRKLAIGELLARIEASAGEAWADELLAHDFARLAPEAIREIDESVLASSARKRAVDTRAAAFGPAYEEFLSFKAAVRAGMGAASAAYQRLAYRPRSPEPDETGAPGAKTQPEPA